MHSALQRETGDLQLNLQIPSFIPLFTEYQRKEHPVIHFWKQFLEECGRASPRSAKYSMCFLCFQNRGPPSPPEGSRSRTQTPQDQCWPVVANMAQSLSSFLAVTHTNPLQQNGQEMGTLETGRRELVPYPPTLLCTGPLPKWGMCDGRDIWLAGKRPKLKPWLPH